MLQLLLVRHGEAPKQLGETDFERKLNALGIAQGQEAAEKFQIKPDIVYSSNASRAVNTAKLSFPQTHLEIVEELYNAIDKTILKFALNIDNKNKVAALVAHNPGITSVIPLFNVVGEIPTSSLNYNTTCKIVVIEFETDNWREIDKAPCKISEVYASKQN